VNEERPDGGSRTGPGPARSRAAAFIRSTRGGPGRQLAGPLATLGVLAGLELLALAGFRIPSPTPVYLLAVIYAAAASGLVPGLASAALCIIFEIWLLPGPGQALASSGDDRRRLLVIALTAPAMALVGALLGRRIERANHRAAAQVAATMASRQVVEALTEVGQVFARTMDPGHVGRRIVESVRTLLGTRSAGLYALEPATGHLVVTAVTDEPTGAFRPGLSFPPGTGLGGLAVREGRPVQTADFAGDPRITYTPEVRRRLETAEDRALLAVPLVVQANVIGALAVADRPGRVFGPAEIALIETFANQAAVALENARLYGEMLLRGKRLEMLTRVNRTLTASVDASQILPVIVEAALALFPGGVCRLWIADGGGLRIGAEAGVAPGERQGPDVTVGQALIGDVCAVRAARILTDVYEHQDLAPVDWMWARWLAAVAVFPLVVGDRCLGALELFTRAAPGFAAGDVEVLQAFAEEAAIALEKARLFAENTALLRMAEGQRVRLEQIFASTSDGILVVDLEGRVVALNEQGARLAGVPAAEVVGHPFAELVGRLADRVDWASPGPGALAALVRGAPARGAGDLQIAGALPRTLRWRATATTDRDRHPVGVTVTLQDVTREREIDRMKTEFVSRVSHELRTPLAAIQGHLELVADGDAGPVTDLQGRFLGAALEGARRFSDLISDILDVEAIESRAHSDWR
jgi:GAF domain-containing protein